MESHTPDSAAPELDPSLRSSVQRSLGALRRAARPSLTALLCSAACTPIVVASLGTTGIAGAALGVLGGVGGGALTNVITGLIERLDKGATETEVQEAIAEQLDRLADGGSAEAAALRTDIAEVLDATGAVRVAIETAVAEGDQRQLSVLLAELQRQADTHVEFAALLFQVRDATAAVIDGISGIAAMQHHLDRKATALLQAILDRLAYLPESEPVRPRAPAGPPYRGLWPYGQDQAGSFFGRERAIAALLARVEAAASEGNCVVVTGASGVGKSSLIHAGLLPALTDRSGSPRGSREWRTLALTPGSTPVDALAAGLASLGGSDAAATRRALRGEPGAAHLLVRQRLSPEDGSSGRLVLVVDQFEELFTAAEEEDRTLFIEAICAIVGSESGSVVVIGVRGDFIDRCALYPQLVPLLQHRLFVVGPMSTEELRQAVSGPAEAAGLALDEGLADDLLADLREATGGDGRGVLPLLSQTMLMLWQHSDKRRLTRRDYAAIGGASDAVLTAAERVYAGLDAERQGVAERLLRRLVHVALDGTLSRRTVRSSEITELGPVGEAVLAAFIEARLMVGDRDTVAVAHDTLLRDWTRLREWMRDDLASLAVLSQLREDAAQWERSGRDASFLYSGKRLTEVEDQRWSKWRSNPHRFPPPGPQALAFLADARRHERNKGRIRRTLTAAVAGLAALALIAVGTALVVNQRSIEQRDEQISAQLAADSLEAAATDGDLARLLAVAAWEISETDQAWAAMAQSIDNPAAGMVESLIGGYVPGFEVFPDGSMALAQSPDVLEIWDDPVGESRREVQLPHNVQSVVSSPDDSVLAALGGLVSLVDRESGEVLTTMNASALWGRSVSFNEDGSMLAAVSAMNAVTVWDTATFETVSAFEVDRAVQVVSFVPGTDRVMAGMEGGGLSTWDISSGAMSTEERFPSTVYDIDFNPADPSQLVICALECVLRDRTDGSETGLVNTLGRTEFSAGGEYAATLLNPSGLAVWSTSDLSMLALLPVSEVALLQDFSFSANDASLLVASDSGLVRWKIDLARPVVGTGVPSWTYDLEIADGGDTVIATGDGGAITYDISTDTIGKTASKPDLAGLDSALSSDEKLVASIEAFENGKSVRIWDRVTGETVRTLTGHTGYVVGMDFNEGSDQLATISRHELAHDPDEPPTGDAVTWTELLIWDVGSGEVVTAVEGPEDWIPRAVDFRPDGEAVAVLDATGAVSEWDPRTGERISTFTNGPVSRWDPFDVRYAPDGASFAVADEEGVTLWDRATETSRTFRSSAAVGIPYGFAHDVAFSPDGTFLAASFADLEERTDAAVLIWDLERGEVVSRILTSGTPGALAFTPDGEALAVVGYGSSLMRFELGYLGDPESAACAQTDRRLTDEEWATYLPSVPKGSLAICA